MVEKDIDPGLQVCQERPFAASDIGRSIMGEMLKQEYEVIDVAPDGLGYGEGSISYKERMAEVGKDRLDLVLEAIKSNKILVRVDVDSDGRQLQDDGCGDGRGVGSIFKGLKQVYTKSLHRAKVFGGGLTMGLAGRIGVNGMTAPTLNDEFEETMVELDERSIEYGAHSDGNHKHGKQCGCGALDKANVIIQNVDKYEEKIKDSLRTMGVSDDGQAQVFGNFSGAAAKIRNQDYSGLKVFSRIRDKRKVTKELVEDHREMFIVLNDVEGMTVDQDYIRTISDGLVQVFAVDLWRLKGISKKQFPGDEKAQKQALLGELAYTLGTAATLTKGDLPVFLVKAS